MNEEKDLVDIFAEEVIDDEETDESLQEGIEMLSVYQDR